MRTALCIIFIPLFVLGQQVQTPGSNIPSLSTEITSPTERIQREAKGNLFNYSGKPLPLTLGDNQEFYHLAIATMRPLPELPISDSNVIVSGEVTALQVFLSSNAKALYTEYTFKVDQAVKMTKDIPAGAEISIVRLGGVARLQTGGTLRYEVKGYGPSPVVGGKYLMFLNDTPPTAQSYAILKFWDIKGGVITAAFEGDVVGVQQAKSLIHGRPLQDVLRLIASAVSEKP